MSYALSFAVQAAVLFGFWLLLSGRFDALFLGMGLVSALGVTALTHDLLARAASRRGNAWRSIPRRAWHAAFYLVWLVARIVVSSTQVAYIVLHPRMPLDTGVARLRTQLRSPTSRAVLANTITLIPGTMTVGIDGDELTVHVLTPRSADDLATGRMQNVIGRMFGEEHQPPATLYWDIPTSEGR